MTILKARTASASASDAPVRNWLLTNSRRSKRICWTGPRSPSSHIPKSKSQICPAGKQNLFSNNPGSLEHFLARESNYMYFSIFIFLMSNKKKVWFNRTLFRKC
jgi:hypothetical protein